VTVSVTGSDTGLFETAEDMNVTVLASAPTIPWAQNPRTLRSFIRFTRSMVLPFRSFEGRSEATARSQSSSTVVWQGSAGDRRPYADQTALAETDLEGVP